MRIRNLRLKHFKPIKYSLLGREEIMLDFSSLPDGLVAVVGKNGAAKTTIIDNCHPFRIMPFRAKQALPDMVYDNAEKDLIWEHEGTVYRSLLKINAKTRDMQSFLSEMAEDGTWKPPMVDGRNNDYDAAVEKILGITEKMFFITRFRSQDAQSFVNFQKNDFREVFEKMIPELEYLLNVSERASAQRKLVDTDLGKATSELASVEKLLASLPAREKPDETIISDLERSLAEKRLRATEIQEIIDSNTATLSSLDEQSKQLSKNTADAKTRLSQREKEINERRKAIARKTHDLGELIIKKNEILQAVAKLPGLKNDLKALQEKLAKRNVLVTEISGISQTLSGLRAETAALRKQLASASGIAKLLHEVPCDGEEKQSSCKLLASGVEMAAKIPGMNEELSYLLDNTAMSEEELKNKNAELASEYPEKAIPQSLLDNISETQTMAARAELLAHAERQITDLSIEGKKLESTLMEAQQAAALESSSVKQRLEKLQAERQALSAKYNDSKNRKTLIEQEINTISTKVENLRTDRKLYEENERRKGVINEEIATINKRIERLTRDLYQWKHIEEGFGRNGLIALELELAAPAVSDIANALLTEMGGRFAIRFDTLEPKMTRGKITGYKESFSVKVFDGEKGIEKALIDLSGGERVWVDEAMARGIGIYNSRNTGANLGFLVSDERDGALDADKKLEYMAMKRKVLELGGDKQEIFISHTPEVWDLADEVIEVGSEGVRLRNGRSIEVEIHEPVEEKPALPAVEAALPQGAEIHEFPKKPRKRKPKTIPEPQPEATLFPEPREESHADSATMQPDAAMDIAMEDQMASPVEEEEEEYRYVSPG